MKHRQAPKIIALSAVVLSGAGLYLAFRAPGGSRVMADAPPAPGYAGNKACGRCHAQVFTNHARSGHARTLERITTDDRARLPPSDWIRDPVLPILYRVNWRDGTIGVEVRAGQVPRWQPAQWLFGSGRHGITLVASLGAGRYIELPLSHYPGRGWDFTPGFLAWAPEKRMYHPAGVPADKALFFECYDCHATNLVEGDEELEFRHMWTGVQCERCHGAGQAHIQAAEAGRSVVGTIKASRGGSAAAMTALCGECHRDKIPPGLKREDPMLVRFAPVGLLESECYRKSQGRLSCVTCHDPHADVKTDSLHYVNACLSCHPSGLPGSRQCPVNPKSGCVECHMPKSQAARNSLFTDHWIRVRKSGASAEPARPIDHSHPKAPSP